MEETDSDLSDNASLAGELVSLLNQVPMLPRRLVLNTQGVSATVPVLRGVWGRALHGLDSVVYERVFHPKERERLPGYVLRPGDEPPDELEVRQTVLEWILLGEAVEDDDVLLRAWDVASGMGVGAERTPFFVRERVGLHPDSSPAEAAYRWPLSEAAWPAENPAHGAACRIRFTLPVSLLREHRLILEPTLTDVVVRTCRRIGAFLPAASRDDWRRVTDRAISLSRELPWRGQWEPPLALARYSAAQQRDFAVPGVCGHLDLPAGPGQLWPLLAALAWTHVGKACNLGLGQARIETGF